MAKAELKTQATGADVDAFLAAVEPDLRRDEGHALKAFFDRLTGWPARMWGPSIVGYGRYRYKYESGREGEYLVTGFSPRKAALTVYIMPGYGDFGAQLARLGKHRTGKSCIYINKLADIDLAVLEEIVAQALAVMKARYEVTAE